MVVWRWCRGQCWHECRWLVSYPYNLHESASGVTRVEGRRKPTSSTTSFLPPSYRLSFPPSLLSSHHPSFPLSFLLLLLSCRQKGANSVWMQMTMFTESLVGGGPGWVIKSLEQISLCWPVWATSLTWCPGWEDPTGLSDILWVWRKALLSPVPHPRVGPACWYYTLAILPRKRVATCHRHQPSLKPCPEVKINSQWTVTQWAP